MINSNQIKQWWSVFCSYHFSFSVIILIILCLALAACNFFLLTITTHRYLISFLCALFSSFSFFYSILSIKAFCVLLFLLLIVKQSTMKYNSINNGFNNDNNNNNNSRLKRINITFLSIDIPLMWLK